LAKINKVIAKVNDGAVHNDEANKMAAATDEQKVKVQTRAAQPPKEKSSEQSNAQLKICGKPQNKVSL
jgi:hypothetical protein